MEDCGDGFDWRTADPSLSFWVESEPLRFTVLERGENVELEALAVFHASGHVEFGRCVAGLPVQAHGVCRPLTLAGTGESWQLEMASVTAPKDEFGSGEDAHSETIMGRAGAALERFTLASGLAPLNGGELVARLPIGKGVLIGLGVLADSTGSQVQIRFDEGSVSYAH